ncbi:MAG: hypothetical protein OXH73_08030, partial [Caldilineaceae bacterium]|nr:hypothetical protein [Caldilineaceae bacterium]
MATRLGLLGFSSMGKSQWYDATCRIFTPLRTDVRNGRNLRKYDYLRKCASFGIKAVMKIPRESIAIRMVLERLAEIFGVSELAEDTHIAERSDDGGQWDAVFAAGGLFFGLEWKGCIPNCLPDQVRPRIATG